MRIQGQEELVHAMKLHDYICDRGGRVLLTAIAGPPTEWDSPLAAFQATAEHEHKVTLLINDLVNIAIATGDHATNNYLQWFVAEQVEEEASAAEVVQKLTLTGESGPELLVMDRELSQRVFAMPADTQAKN